jgi:GDP-L-fucose synthase
MTAHGVPRDAPIYVAGHRGLVGSALLRALERGGFRNVLTVAREEVDLRDPSAVRGWFSEHRPAYVYLVAGTVGGILPNSTRPADFLYDNLMIHASVVHAAWEAAAEKLLYLGSSCVYPREAPQPIREEALLTGPLEPTNEAYAVAKIAGIKLCQAYRRQHGCRFVAAMPTNLYGPGDRFDPEAGHVLPALMRKFHEAREAGVDEVTVWGSGTPRREFMHCDDLADACLFLMDRYEDEPAINVGTGVDLTIAELADAIRRVVHPRAKIVFDPSMPDGMRRKVLDVSRLHALGWRHRTSLEDGIASTYAWFRQHHG